MKKKNKQNKTKQKKESKIKKPTCDNEKLFFRIQIHLDKCKKFKQFQQRKRIYQIKEIQKLKTKNKSVACQSIYVHLYIQAYIGIYNSEWEKKEKKRKGKKKKTCTIQLYNIMKTT